MNGPLLDPVEALSRRFIEPETLLPVENEADQLQIRIGFLIDQYELLLPVGTEAETVNRPDIYHLPNTPPWCLGLINLRGNLLPIFDLHQLLGVPVEKRRYVLTIGQGSETAGFMVDDLPFSVDLPPQSSTTPRQLMPELLEHHLGRHWPHEGNQLVELNHLSFLGQLVELMNNQQERTFQ